MVATADRKVKAQQLDLLWAEMRANQVLWDRLNRDPKAFMSVFESGIRPGCNVLAFRGPESGVDE